MRHSGALQRSIGAVPEKRGMRETWKKSSQAIRTFHSRGFLAASETYCNMCPSFASSSGKLTGAILMPPTFATTGEELGEARGRKPTRRSGEGLVCGSPRVSVTGWSLRKQAGDLRYTSPKASGGENVDIEEPVSCWGCSSLHFYPTLPGMLLAPLRIASAYAGLPDTYPVNCPKTSCLLANTTLFWEMSFLVLL